MEERVKDYPDLVKVDRTYIINTNEEKYRATLLRRKTNKQLGTIEERLSNLEEKLQLILDHIQGNSN